MTAALVDTPIDGLTAEQAEHYRRAGIDPAGPDPAGTVALEGQVDRWGRPDIWAAYDGIYCDVRIRNAGGVGRGVCSRRAHPTHWGHIAVGDTEVVGFTTPVIEESDGPTPEAPVPGALAPDPLAHLRPGDTVERDTPYLTRRMTRECYADLTGHPVLHGSTERNRTCRRREHPAHWNHLVIVEDEVLAVVPVLPGDPVRPPVTVAFDPAEPVEPPREPDPLGPVELEQVIDLGDSDIWASGYRARRCGFNIPNGTNPQGFGTCSRVEHADHWRHVAVTGGGRVIGIADPETDSFGPATPDAVTPPDESTPAVITIGRPMKYRNRKAVLIPVHRRRDGRYDVIDLDHDDGNGRPRARAVEASKLVDRPATADPLTPEQVARVAEYFAWRRGQTRDIGVRELRNERLNKTNLGEILAELDLEPYTPRPNGRISLTMHVDIPEGHALHHRDDGYATGDRVARRVRDHVAKLLAEHPLPDDLHLLSEPEPTSGGWHDA